MVTLRPYDQSDLETLVRIANNPNVARYLREVFPSPYTIAAAQWWIDEGQFLTSNLSLAITVENELAGGVGAHFFDNEHRYSAEVGYWLGESYWGKGIATTALQQFTEQLFARDDINRLFAPVAGDNIGSMRVLEKCGFKREGIFRQAMYLRGVTYDEHVFAKLKEMENN